MTGVGRSNGNPFGDYVGTWDLPKTIPGPYHLVKVRKQKYFTILKAKIFEFILRLGELKKMSIS